MSYAYTHAVVSAREDIKRQPILCASMCAHASFFCFTKGLAFCYFCNPLSCPECVLPAMPLEFQTRSSDHRYLIIAVETILSPERGDNPKFAMLFDGVFTLEQCEAYLRAMDFTDFNPLPPLDAFFQPRKVGLRVLGAHCSHGIIGPPWWHHFKELFGKEFGNLEFTDEYSFHIWYHFLERGGQDHANDIDNADATVVHEVAPGVYHKTKFFNQR